MTPRVLPGPRPVAGFLAWCALLGVAGVVAAQEVRVSHLAKAWYLEPAGDWIWDAACTGAPADWFFDQVHPAARELCAACPVRTDCLDLAIANDEQHGFWGGMTTHERRWEKKRRRVA